MGPSQSFQTYHQGQHIRNTWELWIAMIKLRSWTNPKKLCVGIEKLKENFLASQYTMLMSLKEVLLSMNDQVKGSVTFWNSNWNLRMNWLDKCVFVKGLEDPDQQLRNNSSGKMVKIIYRLLVKGKIMYVWCAMRSIWNTKTEI